MIFHPIFVHYRLKLIILIIFEIKLDSILYFGVFLNHYLKNRTPTQIHLTFLLDKSNLITFPFFILTK